MTIAKWLDGDDMSLAAFVAAQQLSGGDPVKTLATALAGKKVSVSYTHLDVYKRQMFHPPC